MALNDLLSVVLDEYFLRLSLSLSDCLTTKDNTLSSHAIANTSQSLTCNVFVAQLLGCLGALPFLLLLFLLWRSLAGGGILVCGKLGKECFGATFRRQHADNVDNKKRLGG